jgi:hypothetical protein
MATIKTMRTDQNVTTFIKAIDDETKRDDSFKLIEIMSAITGEQPYMYGPTIVGFGNYHYKYESGHEGDAPLAGFSPRKAAISLYLSGNFPKRDELLAEFGKHKAAKGCVYVKKLADIKLPVLEKMVAASVKHVLKKYPSSK